ncbi:MAG: AAA family ATPase, partial [Anaerolineae bacterium]
MNDGIALKLLKEKEGVKIAQSEEELFAKIDEFFAKSLFGKTPHSDSAAIFAKTLMAASRQGHLCIRVTQDAIHPPVEELFDHEKVSARLTRISHTHERKCGLKALLFEGVKTFPSHLFEDAEVLEKQSNHPVLNKLICRFGDAYYLQKNWALETTVLQHLQRLALQPLAVSMDFQGEFDNCLSEDQAQAVRNVFRSRLSIITGGPGTGKTYTACHLIRCFKEAFFQAKGRQPLIFLAAPTG